MALLAIPVSKVEAVLGATIGISRFLPEVFNQRKKQHLTWTK
jgi:hypothetical protein